MRLFATLFVLLTCALPARAEILVGVAGPFSGPNASYGNELRVGASAAVAALNASGGINGEPLAIIEGDDACDAKKAIDVAKTFVGRDVRMVVGHFCTSASLAAAPTYNAAGILMFNPAVTSPELTSKNLWNVFRATGRDDRQGELAATRMKSDGIAGDAIMITDGLAETAKLAKGFADALPNAKVITIKAGSAKLPDEPGVIVASAFYLALQANDAADVTKLLRKLNTSARILGPDTLQSEAFGTRAEADANGVLVSFLRDNATIADPTVLSKLPQSEGATLATHAALEIFATAAKATSVNDSRAMATWLTSGNEAQTIIGKLGFNASGDLKQQPYVWYTWTAGALVPESP